MYGANKVKKEYICAIKGKLPSAQSAIEPLKNLKGTYQTAQTTLIPLIDLEKGMIVLAVPIRAEYIKSENISSIVRTLF